MLTQNLNSKNVHGGSTITNLIKLNLTIGLLIPPPTLAAGGIVWDMERYRFFLEGKEAGVMFASHHWPRWGKERIQEVLRGQHDLYANINNQVLNLANQAARRPQPFSS